METAPPTAVILGATGGIGRALVHLLHERGYRLFLVARDAERLAALAADTQAEWLATDVTSSAQVDAAFAQATQSLGQLDAVAHGVGSILLKPAHLTTDEEWAATLSLNLNSAFYVVRAATRAMQRTGGSIALVSSVAARLGLANHEAIAAAKGGVQGLALAAAATYAPRGIRVNVVAPGLVETPLAARITGHEAARKASEAMHPLGRIGQPDDVARALAWLLDPAQSWVTGQVIGVDGGLGSLRAR
jgi:3-oxoacyl-[acyl-carrier protein] reductase